MKAEYIGMYRHKFDTGVDLFYRYRGKEYVITDEHNGYSEPMWVKHKNEQARIDRELDTPPSKSSGCTAQEGFDMFWHYCETGEW